MNRPVRYRWDRYGDRRLPGPWFEATPGKLMRAFRALRMPQERLRVEFETGERLIFRRPGRRETK